MKISIITATWNSEASIGDTIASLAVQDYPRERIEWIVVDGNSSDNTLGVVRDSGFTPDQLVSEPDKGIYDALNKGVRMATGDIVGFLHADDFYAAPDVLTRVGELLSDSGADAVYGDLQYIKEIDNTHGTDRKHGCESTTKEHKDEQGTACGDNAKSAIGNRQSAFRVIRHWRSGSYRRSKLQWGWMPPHPSFFLKRDVYDRVRLENGDYFDTSYACAADYDFMVRSLFRYNIEPVHLEKVLVCMRVGGISNRSLKHIIQKSREDWRVIRSNRIGGIHTLVGKNIGKLGQFLIPRQRRVG